MALSAAMKWTVKTGGSSGNSGGFRVGASGTDYTKQNAAQFSVTDLAIDAVDNTKVTSATIGFDATSPGNTLIVSAGAGFTTGTFEILSVAAGVATLDRAVGTIGSTGGTAKLGGAKSRLDDCDGVLVAGNTIYVEAGTYTSTTTNTLTADGTATAKIRVIGYTSGGSQTDADITEANMPVMTSATNSIAIITMTGAPFWSFRNIKITHTAGTRGNGIVTSGSITSFGPQLYNCVFDGCLSGINEGSVNMAGMQACRCTIRNSTSHGVVLNSASSTTVPMSFDSCHIYSNAGAGITAASSNLQGLSIKRSVIHGNTGANGHGIWLQQTTAGWNAVIIDIDSNVLYNNAQSGLRAEFTTTHPILGITNNILVSNGAYGVSFATAGMADTMWAKVYANAYYNNTSGARQNFVTGDGDVTLSGVPFTSAGSNDFTLDNTASEGAACRSAAFPSAVGALGGTAGTNYGDIGPLQAQATAGGGTVAYGFAG